MRSMAIVAFGTGRVSQRGSLAVIRLEVSVRDVLVAFSALVHDAELERRNVGPCNGVRGVTIVAVRKLGHPAHAPPVVVRVALDGVNAMLELFIDAVVAAPARGHDVLLTDRGLRITMRQFPMGGVAIGACGGHGEPA